MRAAGVPLPFVRWTAAVLLLVVVARAAGLAGQALAALEFPRLTSRVVDNADLMSAEQELRLVAQLRSHEEVSSNQLVVVTLPSLQGTAIDNLGNQLRRHWGTGQQARENSSLMLVD